jgi:ribosome-associated protein
MVAEESATQSSCPVAFAVKAAKLMIARHCDDVLLLDVTGLSQVCDYVLIGTGTSDRQMKSVSSELDDIGSEVGYPAFRTSIDTGVTWIVVDFITVVIHLFEPQRRAYYDLEDLWADARRVDLIADTSVT